MLGAAFALGGSAGLCLAARQRLREHSAAEVTPEAAPPDPRRALPEACGDPAAVAASPREQRFPAYQAAPSAPV